MTAKKNDGNFGPGKRERYVQPTILLGLKIEPSYGYELIQNLQEFGFIEGQAPPGMIYRHLRPLEEDGLVLSKWITEGSGPAKRMYEITAEGGEILGVWADYMQKQADKIQKFVGMYTDCVGKEGLGPSD